MAIVDGLISLDDMKRSLGNVTGANEADLEKYIEAATPVIENITGPLIVRTRVFSCDGGDWAVVLGSAFSAVTSVVESGVTVTDYVADPSSGIVYAGTTAAQREFRDGVQNVVVTVTVGAADVPANVQLATRELVRFWWQQGRQGNRPGFGNEGISELDVPSGFAVPRRVIELLQANPRSPGFA